MKIIRNILVWLLLAFLLAISFVGTLAYMPWFERINQMGSSWIEVWHRGNGLFWLWMGLFLGTLVTFVLTVAIMRRRAMVYVPMGEGQVVIMESAIRKYIRTALTEVPGVMSRRIELKKTRRGLHVVVYAQVRTNEKLPDIEKQVEEQVRTALTKYLGIKSMAGVQVYVDDLEVGLPRGGRPEGLPAAEQHEVAQAPSLTQPSEAPAAQQTEQSWISSQPEAGEEEGASASQAPVEEAWKSEGEAAEAHPEEPAPEAREEHPLGVSSPDISHAEESTNMPRTEESSTKSTEEETKE